jgi:hypothetical protein
MSKSRHNCKKKSSRRKQAKHQVKQTAKKFIKYSYDVFTDMAVIKIKREAFYQMMRQLSSGHAERGGILLGPIGKNYITYFYYDHGGACTGTTYSPDYVMLNRKMREQWLPAGLDMKGFAHSHPGNLDSLTAGDMSYIKRLLHKNYDMDKFVAPIVLPNQYSVRPLIVSRDRMDSAQQAYFEFF